MLSLQEKKQTALRLVEISTALIRVKTKQKISQYDRTVAEKVYQKQAADFEKEFEKAITPLFKDQIQSAIKNLRKMGSSEKSFDSVKCGGPGGTMGPCPSGKVDNISEKEYHIRVDPFEKESVDQAIADTFKKDIGYYSIALLSGSPSGARVQIETRTNKAGDIAICLISRWGENSDSKRLIYRDSENRLVIENAGLLVEKSTAGQGIGTKLLEDQVHQAVRLGFDRIETDAGQGRHENGYYTWPRLGYDKTMTLGDWGFGPPPAKYGSISKISDLMKTAEGRDWWKEQGSTLRGLVFDLKEGSQSRRVLEAYVQERASRAAAGTKSSGGEDLGFDLGQDWEGRGTKEAGRRVTAKDIFNPSDWNKELINRALPPIAKTMAESAMAQYVQIQNQIKVRKSFGFDSVKCGGPGGTMGPCPRGTPNHISDSDARKRSKETWSPDNGQFLAYAGGVERTEKESKAIASWTYVKKAREVNDHLRNGSEITSEGKEIQDGLDSLFKKSSLPGDVVSYRGSVIVGGIDSVKVGSYYHDKGFSATTLDKRFAQKHADNTATGSHTGAGRVDAVAGEPVVFKVLMPKGSRVTPGAQSALELLVDRDSSFRVVSKTKSEVFVVLEQTSPASNKSHKSTKASTATDWLDSLDEDEKESLKDVVFKTPYGSVSMRFATEYPTWMKEIIETRLQETFAQPYWEDINKTTEGDIENVLSQGLEDGWSIEDMANEMEDRYGSDAYPKSRGRLIARTESGNALNGARSDVIDRLKEELGDQYPLRKVWLSILGNTTRDTHANLDGVPAASDGCWALGGIRCRWPGDVLLPAAERCNCQCSLLTHFGLQDDTADELIAEHELREAGKGKSVLWSVKCGGPGGTMGPCPQHKTEPKISGEGFAAPRFDSLKDAQSWAKSNGSALVLTDAKQASKAISEQVSSWVSDRVNQGLLSISDAPSKESVESNWLKNFRRKSEYKDDKPAFKDLNPELHLEIQNAINQNHTNKTFNQFVEKHGEVPVVFLREEKGRSAAAEYRGAIMVYDSPFWKGEKETDLIPGQYTAGGLGGYAAVIRHEYGHKMYGKLTIKQQQEWSSLLPDSDTVARDVTSYAAKNREETFCEIFAIVTDTRYRKGVFPPWIDDMHEKQKEWLL